MEAGNVGHYAVLTCKVDAPAPFARVDVTCGPSEPVHQAANVWWQLDVRKNDGDDGDPLVQIRALSSRNPLEKADGGIGFERYLVRIPAVHESFEYRNVH